MYLTLHQTFITLLLFFQSKQTLLCIQSLWVFLHSTAFCYFIAPQHTIKTGHPAAWVDKKGFINFRKWTDSEKGNVFFLFFPKGCRINQVLKQLPLTHTIYNALSPLLRWGCKGISCTATVCLKSQAGLLGNCWDIWKIRWEGESCNLRSGQSANIKDSGKQFFSGPTIFRTGSWLDSWLEKLLSVSLRGI